MTRGRCDGKHKSAPFISLSEQYVLAEQRTIDLMSAPAATTYRPAKLRDTG
jgi:hypothetical protein